MKQRLSMFMRYLIIVALLLVSCVNSKAQSPIEVSGYISEMPSYTWQKNAGNGFWDNLVHNRIKFGYSPNKSLDIRLELRNRFFLGETVRNSPLYKFYIDNDSGWADMSLNWGSGKNYLVNTVIDRLSLEKTWGKFQVRIGRQRVNWSQSFVWNPNDIFNSYSYFDFDYPERPGMDGVRMQYYTGLSSRLEAVVKVDGNNDMTSALLYGFNKGGYDIQLITGQVAQDDFILGLGWGGNILNAGFYGEFSYLSPLNNQGEDVYLMSLGANYSFKNSLMITSEYLYSSNKNSSMGSFTNLSFSTPSIKELSITDHSYMFSISYPVNPLLNVTLAYVGFSYPVLKNYYLAPSVEFSVKENLFLSAVVQAYNQSASKQNASAQRSVLSFLRLKKVF